VPHPGYVTLKENAASTQWKDGWMGLRANVIAVEEERFFAQVRNGI
jgi:hypothetical protein